MIILFSINFCLEEGDDKNEENTEEKVFIISNIFFDFKQTILKGYPRKKFSNSQIYHPLKAHKYIL